MRKAWGMSRSLQSARPSRGGCPESCHTSFAIGFTHSSSEEASVGTATHADLFRRVRSQSRLAFRRQTCPARER